MASPPRSNSQRRTTWPRFNQHLAIYLTDTAEQMRIEQTSPKRPSNTVRRRCAWFLVCTRRRADCHLSPALGRLVGPNCCRLAPAEAGLQSGVMRQIGHSRAILSRCGPRWSSPRLAPPAHGFPAFVTPWHVPSGIAPASASATCSSVSAGLSSGG